MEWLQNIWVQMALLVLFATGHGYVGAWLAVRMLFRPRRPIKILGITIFPQGMIPRHRERLANAIGKAVGEELVSSDTIHEQLIGKDFLRNKIHSVVDSYTNELVSQNYPSLINALPPAFREPVLDTVSGLQRTLASYIRDSLANEETRASIEGFISRRVDEVLSKRIDDVVDVETFDKIIGLIDERIRSGVVSPALEKNINEFISRRIDDLLSSDAPVGTLFTPDAVELLKEKANEQIEPAIGQIAQLAAEEKTRDQISALIKREVHEYYKELSFFKKIFVSREMLLEEVDQLVNDSFPKRLEETLRGAYFVDEARNFISSSIDNAMSRPLPVVIGTIDPEQLVRLKAQVSKAVLSLIRSEQTLQGVSNYLYDTLAKLRPHSIDAVLQFAAPGSEEKLKALLSRGLIDILSREETVESINELLAGQIDGLLNRPIGNISDHISEDRIRSLSAMLTDAIVSATAAKLPDAIREFDIGSVVREKIRNYPEEKLESLVMSVAKEHLRTIELFGALFGLIIGLVQAAQFYFYAR